MALFTDEEGHMAYNVTFIPGDGTGPEQADATRRVLEATGVQFDWDMQGAGVDIMKTAGTPLPPAVLESIRRTKVVLKGPTTKPMGANIGDEVALFEPAHGSEPRYTGMNKVNPMAMILSGVLMLRYLNEEDAADRMEQAIADVIAEGKTVTYDMKPDRNDPTAVGTSQVADGIIAKLKGGQSKWHRRATAAGASGPASARCERT